MKHIAFFFALLITFTSCQPKNTSESNNDSIPAINADTIDQTPVTQVSEEEDVDGLDPAAFTFMADLEKADALLMSGTPAYIDTVEGAPSNWSTNQMELVSIQGKSRNVYPADADICDQDLWYRVTLVNDPGMSGWVNGVALLLNPDQKNETYNINGTSYQLYYGVDSDVPDENGDRMGCETLSIPYFYDPAKKTIRLIAADDYFVPEDNRFFVQSYRGSWLALESSDGGNATIQEIREAGQGRWKISLQVVYQDGGTAANIYFTEDNGFFTATTFEEQ